MLSIPFHPLNDLTQQIPLLGNGHAAILLVKLVDQPADGFVPRLRLPRVDKAPRSGQPIAPPKDSPFAALAQLTQPPATPRRKRRPRRKAAAA